MQVMNVAYGGTLHQHLPAIPGLLEHGVPVDDTESLHEVDVEPESLLMATTRAPVLRCSSHHHQGVNRVGEGLRVSGRSRDGLVEAIELVPEHEDDWTRWVVGVQWHPEDTAGTDEEQEALFQGFTTMAKIRSTRARDERGGSSRLVEIASPDPAWPARFEEEGARIRAALGDLVVRIEHIGSTSVPDLPAKPVIDIQLSLASLAPRGSWRLPLEATGYSYRLDPSSIEHEFMFRETPDGARLVNLHLCPAGSRWEARHVWFRDRLRAHPDEREAYAALKRDLAAAHARDMHTYSDGKNDFIRRLEALELERGPRSAVGAGD
jgi:GrpB-like predicted nucleotidyltransferase (UPF0157 family)